MHRQSGAEGKRQGEREYMLTLEKSNETLNHAGAAIRKCQTTHQAFSLPNYLLKTAAKLLAEDCC